MRILCCSNQDKKMLAHFMLFSEADIEYRFLMATSSFIKEEATNPFPESRARDGVHTSKLSRFHKISLGVVSKKKNRIKSS